MNNGGSVAGLVVPAEGLEETRPAAASAGITRGVCRLFSDIGYRVVVELPLGNRRRVDVAAVDRAGGIAVIEVKASVADYRSDGKWREYRPYCDRFYFAVAPEFPRHVLPDDVGIVVADAFQGAVVRDAPEHAMNAARRKAVTVRFARTAAARLQGLLDRPAGAYRSALRMP
ncbi:MAG: MmcB family DNA repair protein [Rhodospirillales bacterium]|nr:MmcB family DNA repair protein [Rhodospirillales bacterium]